MFKNSSGRWITKGLFYELTLPDTRDHCLFTLKDENHEVDGITYMSLKQAFLLCDDPTEYEFANKYLGGWGHWKAIQETKDLAPVIEEWREERDVKLKSIGQKRMVDMAKQEDASFQAVKWLADEGWKEKESKGRPKKADIAKASRKMAEDNSRVKGDLERIRSIK